MKIAIFGLTADPVTSAHMEIITRLSKSYDKVIVVPTNVNYYKNYKGHDRAMYSFTERYDRLVEKCKDLKNVEVNDIERDITEGWRFIDTLNQLIFENGKDNIYYVAMGSDSLQNFKTWYKWEEIRNKANLVVFNRPGYTDNFPTDIDYEYLDMNNDISSTKVRERMNALLKKVEENIEDDDFDMWMDDLAWLKGYEDSI